jgi:O-antigen ligase
MMPSSRSAIDRSSLLLFASGVVLATWLVVPLPSLAFGLPKLVLLSFCTLTVYASLLFYKGASPLSGLMRHPSGKWLALFALTIPLSLLWSVAPLQSFFGASPRYEGVLTYFLYLAVAYIGMCAGATSGGRRVLTKAIVIANIGIVFYGLLQTAGADPLDFLWGSDVFLGRTFSLIGQPNTLGLFLVLTIPFVLLSARLGPKWWKSAGIILFLLNVVVLLSTVSRSAILGLAIAMLFSVSWNRGGTVRVSKKRWVLVVVTALMLAALGAYYSMQRFSVPTEAGRSLDSRSIIWAGGVQMLAGRPMGYGLETVGMLSARNFDNRILQYESLTTRIDRAHNKPLDLWLTLGPLGLLGYYGFVYTMLKSLWKKRRDDMQPYYLTGFLSLLGASITLLFGFNVLVTGLFFWLIAGMMLGALLPQAEKAMQWEKLVLLFLLLSQVVLLVSSAQWVRARLTMEHAEQWFTAGNIVQAVGEYAESVHEFRFDRIMLIQAVETNLMALENAANEETQQGLLLLIEKQLTQLESLTGGEDGMALLLRAWTKAIEGEGDAVDWLLLQAAMKQPAGVVHYRIGLHCYDLMGDEGRKQQIYEILLTVLPPTWDKPESPHGRILWKENPWIEEVYNYAQKRDKSGI